jgi:formate dehydrogenase major subunit
MTIKLTINGQEVETPPETTVLRAAQMAGIDIPTLCHHPRLTPVEECGLCVVEVKGADTLQPSCTLPVSNGMMVQTDTAQTQEARQSALARLFSQRNHFCMFCQASGDDCELQNAAYNEGMSRWPQQPPWQPYPVDASHPYFVLDHNRCILCQRCVRACGELVGNYTLSRQERETESMVAADFDVPLGESSCISCGTCVQVCPTGAFIHRSSAYRGGQIETERVKTTCVGCSVGCGVELIIRDNHLLRIEGNWNGPVNGGLLCKLGRFYPLTENRERILTPLVRKNGSLQPSTWAEALDYVSNKLKPLIGRNGCGVAALASTRLPVEGLYRFKQLFGDKMGSEMVTSIEEGITTGLAGRVAREAGRPFEGNLDALKSADCVVAIGVDLTDHHQVAGFFIKNALPRGTKLITIDPFDNGMHKLADYALCPQKGQDYDLLLGIMAEIVKWGPATGKARSRPDLAQYTAEKVSRTTGVSAATIKAATHLIASARRPVFIYGKGITRGDSPAVLKALLELARLAGALDDEYSAVLSIKGQANSVAAQQYGLNKIFEVKGYQAVYLALGDDHASRRLIRRLEHAPFIAVQASHVSPVTALADVILPTEMWTEQNGYYLNLEGRLQRGYRSLTPPETVRSHLDILGEIAAQLNFTLDEDWRGELNHQIPTNPILAGDSNRKH